MAAPVDSARQGTNITTASTTWNVNVGSPVAGTLLIVFARFAAAPGTVTFTGYTVLLGPQTDLSDDTTTCFWRWADGAEGATDVLNPTNNVKGATICWEVTGAANEAPAAGGIGAGTTGANVAQSLLIAPTNPPQDTLYLTASGGDGEVGAYTAFPTNYGNLITANSGTGGAAASNCFIGGASRQILASSSDNATAFTHATHTTAWTAFAVAIRPPQAAVDRSFPPIMLPSEAAMRRVHRSRMA
jgi:hypothetical protein